MTEENQKPSPLDPRVYSATSGENNSQNAANPANPAPQQVSQPHGFGQRTQAPAPPQYQTPQNPSSGAGGYMPKSPQDILQPREVPPPPKRSKQARNKLVVFLNFCLSSVVFGVLALAAVFYFGRTEFLQPGPLENPKTISIAEGSSLTSITDKLVAAGVISNGFIFENGVKVSRKAGSLKAGEYAFQPGMSMQNVMDTIASGKGIVHKVTIPEGLTSIQILKRIAENEVLEGPMPTEVPAEGSLLPDTYPFQRGMTRAQVIDTMKKAQTKLLDEIWNRRIEGLPISTPQELVTLASIVEKETGKGDERPRVASVFINRLNKGMRLQSDPTIIYGIYGGAGKPKDQPIRKSDIEAKNDYNTYQIDGLPITPIANPGRASLEAVANPSRTSDFYFVADGTGGHVFAETLDEHNNNVKRWRVVEQRLKDEAAKAEAAAAGTQTEEPKPATN